MKPSRLDVNSVLQERIAFLRTAHPEVAYECRLAEPPPHVEADGDLLRGILTNLLENAADAAGAGGQILGKTDISEGRVAIEVHDSGPGLSEQARKSLELQRGDLETNRGLVKQGFVSSSRISQLEATVTDYAARLDSTAADAQLKTFAERRAILEKAHLWQRGMLLGVLLASLAAVSAYLLFLLKRLNDQLLGVTGSGAQQGAARESASPEPVQALMPSPQR